MNCQGMKVLIVHEDPEVLQELSRWLIAAGCSRPAVTSDAKEGRQLLNGKESDVVLSSFSMPGLHPADVLELCQDREFPSQVLVIIDAAQREAAADLLDRGAHGYILKPLLEKDLLSQVTRAVEYRRLAQLKQECDNRLEARVLDRALQVMAREEEIVFRLLAALSLRGDETRNHVRRVGLNSALLAKHIGWTAEAIADLRLAAAMHDLGEIGVADSILLKPGKLSSEEFALIKKHAEIGASLLEGTEVTMLQMARDIALCHHEKWDGTGYPRGLAGEQIPEAARIVAVVDVYDALVSERVYRPPLPADEALSIMTANRGNYFDPAIFDRFMSLLPEIELSRGTGSEEDLDIELS